MWTGIVLGTLGVLSRENWRSIWLMLEVNLISFLPLISYSWSVKKVTILYFLAQRVGSLSLLIRGIVMDHRNFIFKGLLLGLLLKGGFAPLHFWGPLFINKLPKIQTFTFLTWQKIAPLFLLLTSIPKHILCWVLIANALVAALRAISSKRLSVLLFFFRSYACKLSVDGPSGSGDDVFLLILPLTITSCVFYPLNPSSFSFQYRRLAPPEWILLKTLYVTICWSWNRSSSINYIILHFIFIYTTLPLHTSQDQSEYIRIGTVQPWFLLLGREAWIATIF